MVNGKRFEQQKQRQENNNDPILIAIQKARSFSEIKPEQYALPGGFAEQLAKSEKKMKTTQLRKFFSKIKNIENSLKGKKGELDEITRNQLYLIIPELTYARGRLLITPKFFDIITTIIKNKIRNVDDFTNFSRFITALVAYRKVEEQGGKS